MDPVYEAVTQPDGSTVLVEKATGQILWFDPLTGAPLYQTADAAPPPPATENGQPANYIPGSTYVPPAAYQPANVGPNGLPLDPLGNGTVGASDVPPVAGPTPAASDSGRVDYGDGYGYSRGYRGGYRRGSGYSGGGGYGYSGGYGGGSAGYAQPAPPRYANGATHPYFGGPPLVPGGQFAAQDQGYDNRQQVTSTSGATAGPFGVRAAPAPQQRSYGGSAAGSSGGGGGGGGVAKDLYWHFANQLKSRMMGGGSSGYTDYGTTNYRPYRGPDDPRTVRRIEDLAPRLRGPYGRLWGDAQQAFGLYEDPTGMLGKVAPGLHQDSTRYERLQGMPMQQLAMLAGSGQRGWQGGLNMMEDVATDYYKVLNKRLEHGKQGIDYLPFYKKALRKDNSLTDYVNTLGGLYSGMAQGQTLNSQALMNNLMNPARKTYYHEQFKNQPGGTAGNSFLSAYSAILGTRAMHDTQRRILEDRARDLVSQYQAMYSGKSPKRAPALNQWVGARLPAFG